ncbi:DUF7287 family protein [Halorarius litoreus]|uniref:DUF7287 family protein n=1 Tax=Halorarius litoreus TaxID=2962676 RepID=UPI0020CBFC24|nr:hypothetical protein [Halorarius litoreus]
MATGGSARGQTGLDFLVGIGLFLLTVGFVLAFVPGTLTPFSDATEQPLVADRLADTVVAGLAEDTEPNVLNTTCTVAFFGVAPDTGCAFDGSETTTADGLATELGAPAFTRVNVTLERSVAGTSTRTVRCGTASPLAIGDCSSGSPLATGNAVPADASVVTATRAVWVDGQDAVVVVRVW